MLRQTLTLKCVGCGMKETRPAADWQRAAVLQQVLFPDGFGQGKGGDEMTCHTCHQPSTHPLCSRCLQARAGWPYTHENTRQRKWYERRDARRAAEYRDPWEEPKP